MPVIGEPTNARSRRTRTALLAAARRIIEDHGFPALTMSAVADRAHVSRRAVYLHFASRTSLLAAVFDHVNATEELAASLAPVWAAPNSAAAIAAWAEHLARFHPRILALDQAADQARRVDLDAARHHEQVAAGQQAACRRLATRIEDEGRLAPPWTVQSASDMLWAQMSSGPLERLLIERDWSPSQYIEHLTALLRRALLTEPHGDPARPTAR